MIQYIKLLSIFICLTLMFTVSCKENKKQIDKINKQDVVIAKQENTTYNWRFLNAFSLDNSTNEILNLKFKIIKDSIFIKNIGKEALYKGEINSKKYFNRIYDYEYLKRFLSDKFNIKIKNTLIYLRNKNAHKKESILKKYFDDAFIIDNLLFIVNDEDFVVFEKMNVKSINKDTITSNYKINNLPISYNYANNFMQIQLPIAWVSLKPNVSFEDTFIALLPKVKEYQPVILTGMYSAGNSEEFLVILNSENKETSRIKLYYNDAPDGNVENYSYSTYQIEKNYTIKITVYKVKEDLVNNKITEKKSSDIYYTINNKGMIVKK